MERRLTHPRLVFNAHRTDEPLHVLANEDRHHAKHGARRADVDAHDARVRVRAAQKCRVEHAWQTDVVDVVAVAGEDALILYTLDAGTNKPHASFTLPLSQSAQRRAVRLRRCSDNRCSGRCCRNDPFGFLAP